MSETKGARRTAAEILLAAERLVVGTHVDPDGDAIGSLLGVTLALSGAGVDVVPTLADAPEVPSAYRFLPGADLVRPAGTLEPAPVFLALDTPSLERLGDARALAEGAATRIVIDHHPDSGGWGDVNLVDPTSAAVGEMLWEMLPDLGAEPTLPVATCLYVALLTDTGRFQYSNTTPDSLRTAADMVALGVDVPDIARRLFQDRSPGALKLTGLTLTRLRLANNGRVAYSWFDSDDLRACGTTVEETEGLVDEVRSLGGIDVAFLVKCDEDDCRVSLRAKGDCDVGDVARSLGGGGHRAAAGFTFEGTLDALLGVLLPALPGGPA